MLLDISSSPGGNSASIQVSSRVLSTRMRCVGEAGLIALGNTDGQATLQARAVCVLFKLARVE